MSTAGKPVGVLPIVDAVIFRSRLASVLLCVAALVCVAGCAAGASSTVSPAAAHTDAATQAYVALIRTYWSDLRAADTAADGSDIDARACLGEVSPTSPSDVKVVEPLVCRAYAVATLAVHQKFLANLDAIPAPAKFADDDRVFRTHIPQAISDVTALVSACDGSSKPAIIDTMRAYAGDMIPDVTGALDAVDPSVTHNP